MITIITNNFLLTSSSEELISKIGIPNSSLGGIEKGDFMDVVSSDVSVPSVLPRLVNSRPELLLLVPEK